MEFAELLILAIGLSMDAFAISICKGLSVEKLEKKHMVITGLWFGGSQMAMPIIGYFVGGSFYEAIQSVDHWLSFALLLLIGVNIGGAGTLIASLASLIAFNHFRAIKRGMKRPGIQALSTKRYLALFSALNFAFLAVLLAVCLAAGF